MNRDDALSGLREIDPAAAVDAGAAERVRARLEVLIEHEDAPGPRRPGRRARIAGALASAGALGALVVLLVLLVPGDSPAPTGAVSILDRSPQRAADRLPGWVTASPRTRGVDAATSRLAFTRGRRSFYVTRGTAFGEPSICLVDAVGGGRAVARRAGNPGGVNCRPERIMDEELVVALLGGRGAGTARRAGLAGIGPDGFERVVVGDRSAPITNNAFYVTGAEPWEPVVLEGPAGRREYHLGLVRPSVPSSPGGWRRLPVSVLSGDVPRDGILVRRDARGSYRLALRKGRPFLIERDAGGGLRLAGSLAWPTRTHPIALVTSSIVRMGGGPATVSVKALVPDGYTRVGLGGASARIEGNFFVLRDVAVDLPAEILVSGPGVTTLRTSVPLFGPLQTRTQINP